MNIDHRIHEPALPAHLLPSARNAAVLNVTATPEQIAALKEALRDAKPGEVFISGDGTNPLDRGTKIDDHEHEISRMLDEGGPAHDGTLVLPAYVKLTAEEIDSIATDELAFHPELGDFDPRTVSPEDMERIKQRREEINAEMLAQINEEAAETQVESLPGGVRVPEGYRLAGRVSYDDESTRIEFDDLRAICDIENIAGVTATLTRPTYESKHGYVSLRVIHDHAGVAYLFRKDENTHTHFKVAFGGGAV